MLRYLENVVTLEYRPEECAGCGRCVEVCPHGVFEMNGRAAVLKDRDACIECGACANNCPVSAISVVPGVGCAEAIMRGWITGSEPSCGCSDDGGSCC